MLKNTLHKIRHFLADQSGPTAVEYAMMLALVIMVAMVGITTFGQATAEEFAESARALTQVAGS